ncbi:hypothetical protein I4U23_020361 [Adineta vaga]|nr:hypothetical protein I4U23_020361 [Adineta vaga]
MLNHPHLALTPHLLLYEANIYRRQKILFILIDILFTFDLIVFLAYIHLYSVNSWMRENVKFYYPLIWIFCSIIYDVFGLIVSYLCSRICLRVYAWMGIFFFICSCVVLGMMLFIPRHKETLASNEMKFYTPRYIVFVIFWICILSLRLITIRFAFILSKLITHIEQQVIESIDVCGI